MATYKALTNQTGRLKLISSPDVLSVGSGATTNAGNMTISSAGLTTTLADANTTVTNTLTVGSLLIVSLSAAGFNTAPMPVNLFGYLNGPAQVLPTDALAMSSSIVVGFYAGVAGQLAILGQITNAPFVFAGGLPSPGAPVYLALSSDDAGTGAGKLTATAPVAAGQVVAEVGICTDNSTWPACKVLFQVKAPIQL